MALREIEIDELQIGMYVTKLDISWLDSPFLVHQIRIKSSQDIAKLRGAKVKRVVIDPGKTVVAGGTVQLETSDLPAHPLEPAPQTVPPAVQPAAASAPVLATATSAEPQTTPPITQLAKELGEAQRVATQAKQTLQRVMDDALSGKAIDKSRITPIIADTFASLGRNDQALLTLMHLERHGGARQVTHAFSVLSLAMALGHQLNLPREELEILGLAALLHDVGWVRLPASLFGKSRPYTDKEQKLVGQHVSLGLSILAKSPDLPKALPKLIGSHHERTPGKPAQQATPHDTLATAGRILAVVDAYDSVLHGLEDQAPMQPTAALRTLFVQTRAGQFDADIMGHLVQVLGIYPLTSIAELNTGEIAVVVELKRPHSLQPVVKICYTANKQPVLPPIIVDLTKPDNQQPRRIERVLSPEAQDLDPYNLLKIDLPAA
jgi:HD-GYP domain-containing protein (c-di-GMP phosphodiesterase class II)